MYRIQTRATARVAPKRHEAPNVRSSVPPPKNDEICMKMKSPMTNEHCATNCTVKDAWHSKDIWWFLGVGTPSGGHSLRTKCYVYRSTRRRWAHRFKIAGDKPKTRRFNYTLPLCSGQYHAFNVRGTNRFDRAVVRKYFTLGALKSGYPHLW